MSEKPAGMAPREIETVSDIDATSPPPPLDAVVEAIACAVSSYCSRVGGFDEEVQATSRDPKVSQVMRFMGSGRARHGPERQAHNCAARARRCIARTSAHMQRAWRNPTALPASPPALTPDELVVAVGRGVGALVEPGPELGRRERERPERELAEAAVDEAARGGGDRVQIERAVVGGQL